MGGAWEEDPSRWEETTLSAPRHSDDGAFNEIEDPQASDQLNIKNQIANTNPIVEEAPTAGVALSEVDDYKPRSSDQKAAGTSAKRRTRRRRRNKRGAALSEVDDYKPRSSDDKAAGTSAKRRTRRRRRNKKSVALSEVVDDTWFV